MSTPTDDRSALARAYGWASKVVSVAIGMVVPGLLGYWVDQKIGTRALLTVVGFGVGVSYGIWQLIRLGQPQPPTTQGRPKSDS